MRHFTEIERDLTRRSCKRQSRSFDLQKKNCESKTEIFSQKNINLLLKVTSADLCFKSLMQLVKH
jgi:hypothetical protein